MLDEYIVGRVEKIEDIEQDFGDTCMDEDMVKPGSRSETPEEPQTGDRFLSLCRSLDILGARNEQTNDEMEQICKDYWAKLRQGLPGMAQQMANIDIPMPEDNQTAVFWMALVRLCMRYLYSNLYHCTGSFYQYQRTKKPNFSLSVRITSDFGSSFNGSNNSAQIGEQELASDS